MYDLIQSIINHVWDTSLPSSNNQSIIYYTCSACILLLTIWILDRISVFIISCAKGGK